jgi:hypothetical protein
MKSGTLRSIEVRKKETYMGTLSLPFAGNVSSSGNGFEVTNMGTGLPSVAIAGKGTGTGGVGVLGTGTAAGVFGESSAADGVHGQTVNGAGVSGESQNGNGVRGSSAKAEGVYGETLLGSNGVHGKSANSGGSGVWGENTGGGYGVSGSTNSNFVAGSGVTAGVWGNNAGSGTGVKGTSIGGDAIVGVSSSKVHAGVSAVNDSGGFGVWARGTPAGHFEGNVEITANLTVNGDVFLPGADCAERFDVDQSGTIEPGTVMVINDKGVLEPSHEAYDHRVAGVISGAGEFRPGIILDTHESECARVSIALVGKVFCKVDARYSAIGVGDLLTSSPTPGYAMKAGVPLRAFGAVIGKALRPLMAGQGLIPILIALQ